MSEPFEGVKPETTGNNLPATVDAVHLPATILFAGIAEAPYEERKNLYREARDAVYLGFADAALAMTDNVTVEERVAALEFTGSAVSAFLPEAVKDFWFFGTEPSGVKHTLDTAQLALRLEQIRSKGYSLAETRPDHLREAFPPTPLGKSDRSIWQWKHGEAYTAKRTCLLIIDPESLPEEDTAGRFLGKEASGKYTEADLLRAAQIFTEARIFQLSNKFHHSDDAIDKDIKALASLRSPEQGRQLINESLLAELSKLEVILRATAIVKIGIPQYREPKTLIEHGEFIFNPSNCEENGIPFGLTPEEAAKVREKHIRNIEYMAKNARNQDSRPEYAELLANYQQPAPTSE